MDHDQNPDVALGSGNHVQGVVTFGSAFERGIRNQIRERRGNGRKRVTSMKNILLISNKVPHYRVSVYNYLNRRFREHGWEFRVASEGMQPQSKLEVKFDYRELPFAFSKYRALINELKPEVVMFHLHLKDPLFWFLIHWLKLKKVPMIAWTKGANLDRADSRLRHHLFNHFHDLSDALILYSEKQKHHIKQRNHHKIFAANNTVNFEDYPEISETREQIKAEFKIPFRKVVLFAGTMGIDGERKKVDHLIQVFRDLDRDDVGLVLVGGGMSDARKQTLNPRNTLYLGQVHDRQNIQISKLFKAADIFVIPGHVGLGLNQAFYWGLPVVTEDGLHPPEIQYLKPGRNGFMVPENDLAALKERMLFLLDNDAVRKEFSEHAREDILRDASIEHMFQTFYNAVKFVFPAGNNARTEYRAKQTTPA
jgi:glycosyltransferase involved in cell wall biosynthesis